jgi:hypothetical protein
MRGRYATPGDKENEMGWFSKDKEIVTPALGQDITKYTDKQLKNRIEEKKSWPCPGGVKQLEDEVARRKGK